MTSFSIGVDLGGTNRQAGIKHRIEFQSLGR
jgi:hypothetical protein